MKKYILFITFCLIVSCAVLMPKTGCAVKQNVQCTISVEFK